jgi:hypothetical protein
VLSKLFTIIILIVITIPGTLGAQDTLSKREIRKLEANNLVQNKPWTIEIPLWIPGYAGSFAYGDVSVEGDEDWEPVNPIEPPPKWEFGKILSRVFTDNWYLKFFFLTKLAYENNRILAQFDAIAGSLGETVTFNYNNSSFIDATYRSINLRLFAGYKFLNIESNNEKFRYELFGYLGTRLHLQKIYAEIADASITLDINPTWAEPIIGLQNQLTWKRWYVILNGDYGGYFVNTKYSFQLTANLLFRAGKTTSVKLGWNYLDLNHRGTLLNQDFRVDATFSGPAAAVAFHF